jgi:hypothetical protein
MLSGEIGLGYLYADIGYGGTLDFIYFFRSTTIRDPQWIIHYHYFSFKKNTAKLFFAHCMRKLCCGAMRQSADSSRSPRAHQLYQMTRCIQQ